MFSFLDCFDRITGEILTLKIIEKNPVMSRQFLFTIMIFTKTIPTSPSERSAFGSAIISTPTITEIWVMKLMNHIADTIMP